MEAEIPGGDMRKFFLIATIIIFLSSFQIDGLLAEDISQDSPSISGSVVQGYRVLPIHKTPGEIHLIVYRGDYIKFKIDKSITNPVLSIPRLSIKEKIPRALTDAPYFKMKTSGTFPFSLGQLRGTIKVVDYKQPRYREVTSEDAAQLIKNVKPVILDVRTSGEYKKGHLKDSVHIPVQKLKSRLKELAPYKDERILIYCATGNRSTVASKILIDNGFKHIFNMRHGIVDWSKKKLPLMR
jgi:rhodanese-related sulfurtransferase